MKEKYRYVLLCALAGIVGFGFNNHAGGSTFGAMIPGVLITIVISILWRIPIANASIFILFSGVSFGVGGDMNFVHTINLLASGSIAEGSLGALVKGGVWGMFAGVLMGVGLFYNKISRHQLMVALLLGFLGIFLGGLLVHDPVHPLRSLIIDRPFTELWASIGFAALLQLWWYHRVCEKTEFQLISRFMLFGLSGAAVGSLLGGLWIVLGYGLGDAGNHNWVILTQYTLGAVWGATLGYGAWRMRGRVMSLIEFESDPRRDVSYYPTGTVFIGLLLSLSAIYIYPLYFDGVFQSLVEEGWDQIKAVNVFFSALSLFYMVGLVLVYLSISTFKSVWQISLTMPFSFLVTHMLSRISIDLGVEWNYLLLSVSMVVICASFAYGIVFFGMYSSQRLYRYFQLFSGSCLVIYLLDHLIGCVTDYRLCIQFDPVVLINAHYPELLFIVALTMLYYWGDKYLTKE